MQKGRFWLVSTVVIAAAMSMTACGSGEKQESDEVRYVKTVHVRPIAEAAELNYPGKTKSQDETNVAFRVAGTIQRVLVSEGQYVKQGQLQVAYTKLLKAQGVLK